MSAEKPEGKDPKLADSAAVEELLKEFSDEPVAFDPDGEPEQTDEPSYDDIVAERDEMRDRLMRALAESENVRKRAERDRRDAELYGGTKLARDVLPVYDNLARALEAIDDTLREQAAALIEGIELTQKELVSVFNKHQIEKVEPEFGEKFDPNIHQAMFEAPVPGAPAGTIIQVMNAGFMIADRLIRPAQVGVSSTPASKVEPTPDE